MWIHVVDAGPMNSNDICCRRKENSMYNMVRLRIGDRTAYIESHLRIVGCIISQPRTKRGLQFINIHRGHRYMALNVFIAS